MRTHEIISEAVRSTQRVNPEVLLVKRGSSSLGGNQVVRAVVRRRGMSEERLAFGRKAW